MMTTLMIMTIIMMITTITIRKRFIDVVFFTILTLLYSERLTRNDDLFWNESFPFPFDSNRGATMNNSDESFVFEWDNKSSKRLLKRVRLPSKIHPVFREIHHHDKLLDMVTDLVR